MILSKLTWRHFIAKVEQKAQNALQKFELPGDGKIIRFVAVVVVGEADFAYCVGVSCEGVAGATDFATAFVGVYIVAMSLYPSILISYEQVVTNKVVTTSSKIVAGMLPASSATVSL
ncbi:hypothetical protein E3N88_17599 [Mikania micrantha]|uniref:Uncharacterized protein n=1 Tax=Mikania micrantha TaxID=192012 RepID=A0A5N6NU46_9ASTR|nr:hypothetical protein E3N88_17599 [Mikania micrantha]